ncbi:hypothetical protein TorRG33x02_059860 [Trema orientale]|uniref:Uncharacterized protein n=1 Tax=Trema orientale TaxID=63057 RepID=A0A2P5FK69_TREOI|nr:hypothetical protein TorRG33x02_059860 [Trema orientale]
MIKIVHETSLQEEIFRKRKGGGVLRVQQPYLVKEAFEDDNNNSSSSQFEGPRDCCKDELRWVEARTDVAFADDLGRGVSDEECEDGGVNQQTSSDRRGFTRRPWTVAAPARTTT